MFFIYSFHNSPILLSFDFVFFYTKSQNVHHVQKIKEKRKKKKKDERDQEKWLILSKDDQGRPEISKKAVFLETLKFYEDH